MTQMLARDTASSVEAMVSFAPPGSFSPHPLALACQNAMMAEADQVFPLAFFPSK